MMTWEQIHAPLNGTEYNVKINIRYSRFTPLIQN